MKREIGDYIEDILEAMTNAMEFTKDMSYDEFVKDTKTVYAVIRAIEIIGEAVKNIPEETRKKYPDIPWRSMAGMRDKVIHAYFGVKIERVWEVVKRDIPNLKPKFERMLIEEVKD
ncbi:MAG: HEPN domain protein [Candidatus Alkanophagales archaeon MCA70_species_1]|nr:HEPN domain protein [Candidatus Alkanophaga volatiphilum]